MDKFPQILRARREELGLSQLELAKRAFVGRSSVSSYELGRSVPALDVAVPLAKALDLTLDELAGVEPEK